MATDNFGDPKLEDLARIIKDFHWHNYGLDDVTEVPYTDWAWDLAAQIHAHLAPAPPAPDA